MDSKRIYFIHSTGFGFKREYYFALQHCDLSETYKLVFPQASSDEPFSSRAFFETDQCDLVVTEVSHPSTGMGIELGWAIAYGIPILFVARDDVVLSKSIENLRTPLIRYSDPIDLVVKLRKGLNHFDLTD